MNEGFRRFVVLLGVFVLAFLAVFAFRRVQDGEGLFDIFKFGKKDGQENFVPESYTLSTEPALDPGDVKILARLDEEYARLTEAVVPSVVSLHTEGMKRRLMRDWFGRVFEDRYPVKGIGSGVIVSKEGHVVTNQHVTDGKTEIRVTMHDGKSYPAVVIGEDRALDIAVIRIKAKGREFPSLKFGDSDRVRQGQQTFAIGNPFGLGETVTRGIISAKERTLSDKQRDLFQTDAAINPGNSGGPLINIFGEIIGINVAIYSPDTVNQGFVGIGFSIPSNDVWEVFEQILSVGRATRGWLGVQSYDWEPWSQKETGWQEEKGAFIVDVVPKSPAFHAGLKPFDVIMSYDGMEVESRLHFFSLIQRTKIGKEVTMEVWRKRKKIKLSATVIDAEESEALVRQEPATRSATDERIIQNIGLKVQELTLLQRTRGGRGVLVTAVFPGSQAQQRNIRPGDLILRINNVSIGQPVDFYTRLVASAAVQETAVVVQRGRGTYRVRPFERVSRMDDEEER
ncbi:MAG: trypsin-like peptidase domain-containing protein [Roseibacillus sp.]|nr:trypsin-like peptidase domain-containing protein [Roseibacillus sp.]